MMLRVTGKLGRFSGHPMLEHFGFVQAHTRATPKMTIPSPIVAAFPLRPRRRAGVDLSRHERFLSPISATPTARRCAPSPMPAAATCSSTRSISPICAIPSCARRCASAATIRTALPSVYARMINAAISDIPADMTITMHLCRGNFRSTFVASGGYEPVAELLFNTIGVQRLFHGVRHRARRRLRAAALRAEGQDRRARPRHLEDRQAREQGRDQAPHRRGREIRRRSISSACRRNAASPRPRKAIC